MVTCCYICQSFGYMFAWFLWEGAWGVPCFSSPTSFELCKILVFVVSKCWAQHLVPHRAPNIFLLVNEKHTQKNKQNKIRDLVQIPISFSCFVLERSKELYNKEQKWFSPSVNTWSRRKRGIKTKQVLWVRNLRDIKNATRVIDSPKPEIQTSQIFVMLADGKFLDRSPYITLSQRYGFSRLS